MEVGVPTGADEFVVERVEKGTGLVVCGMVGRKEAEVSVVLLDGAGEEFFLGFQAFKIFGDGGADGFLVPETGGGAVKNVGDERESGDGEDREDCLGRRQLLVSQFQSWE